MSQASDGPRASARAALEFVESGHKLGLGTGRAASAFVQALGERVGAGLKGELETLKVRRTTLESREKELNEEHSAGVAPQEVENAVRDYCAQAAQNLRSFTHHDRQHFLRILLHEIIFEGSLVRIRGAIPVHETWNSPTPDSGSARLPTLLPCC